MPLLPLLYIASAKPKMLNGPSDFSNGLPTMTKSAKQWIKIPLSEQQRNSSFSSATLMLHVTNFQLKSICGETPDIGTALYPEGDWRIGYCIRPNIESPENSSHPFCVITMVTKHRRLDNGNSRRF
ncbi:hypothetical protein PoMZ_13479 [Pyricularia oryzae]|uniref:Uncharacterized protein n=1 Tax=Pyricularia oryzae TaxID=318829 RepID=A0A4P7NVG5_PYROR|nr:hypothetical protein PoMZ_13479 [Pyricularia oryzae]